MYKTDLPILPSNWRPLLFVSLLISQKMWDDLNILNNDFKFIYNFFEIDQLNKLEQVFLELIEYNTYIKYSVYFKYYMELRELIKDEPELFFPLKPMNVFDQQKLEKTSMNMEHKLKNNSKTSVDSKQLGENTNYVIN